MKDMLRQVSRADVKGWQIFRAANLKTTYSNPIALTTIYSMAGDTSMHCSGWKRLMRNIIPICLSI